MENRSMKFTRVGGPTFLLEFGGIKLLTDPMFNEGSDAFILHGHPSTGEKTASIARLSSLPPIDLTSIDLILISHVHSDHFDSGAVEELDKNCAWVAANAHLPAISECGFHNGNGSDGWQGVALNKGYQHLNLTALAARHSHDPRMNHESGDVNGFLVNFQSKDGVFTFHSLLASVSWY
jgi:N-acyl-phosphatidylethanolamine-hydrolysing phospholipase D